MMMKHETPDLSDVDTSLRVFIDAGAVAATEFYRSYDGSLKPYSGPTVWFSMHGVSAADRALAASRKPR